MDAAARKKLHVAPLARQEREIRKLLRAGRFRNVTHFVRSAIDHYLEGLGRPALSEQARQMAEDFAQGKRRRSAFTDRAQDASRGTDDDW